MTLAVILAGGFGTRLREVVPDLPKPMALINQRPFLEYLLDYWAAQNIEKFILIVGYKYLDIQNHFGDFYRNIPIEYFIEASPLGTGGALVQISQQLTQPYLLLNGDTFATVDLRDLQEFHRESQSDLTMLLFKADQQNRYGAVDVDNRGVIRGLLTAKSEINSLANAGVYYINPQIFNNVLFVFGQKYSLEDQIIPIVIQEGCCVMGHQQDIEFIDIGIPSDYEKSVHFFSGKV